jgi:beta-1,2-mannobiose phosphorylase / 1,2-beta-oligomannan phosphorylase
MTDFEMTRLHLDVEPEPGNALEVEGILNPAAARGPDGRLYLFPRDVGKGNFSRIGICRVNFGDDGNPVGIERMGVALEPTETYELRDGGTGGCEDPRVTFVSSLQTYVMTYTAFSPNGPRIAVAISEDLLAWRRLGLVDFEPYKSLAFNGVDNKDAAFFPAMVPQPNGPPGFAMLHRPLFAGTCPEDTVQMEPEREIDPHRECIWMSFSEMDPTSGDFSGLTHFTDHHRLAVPESEWDCLKIGCGAPPVLTPHGWLLVYHGVRATDVAPESQRLTYSAGVMVLAEENPLRVEYRSLEPTLVPEDSVGPRGTFSNVVFPTGLDRRDDIGQPDRFDVYYGMNDFRIEAASFTVPRVLPATRTTT